MDCIPLKRRYLHTQHIIHFLHDFQIEWYKQFSNNCSLTETLKFPYVNYYFRILIDVCVPVWAVLYTRGRFEVLLFWNLSIWLKEKLWKSKEIHGAENWGDESWSGVDELLENVLIIIGIWKLPTRTWYNIIFSNIII